MTVITIGQGLFYRENGIGREEKGRGRNWRSRRAMKTEATLSIVCHRPRVAKRRKRRQRAANGTSEPRCDWWRRWRSEAINSARTPSPSRFHSPQNERINPWTTNERIKRRLLREKLPLRPMRTRVTPLFTFLFSHLTFTLHSPTLFYWLAAQGDTLIRLLLNSRWEIEMNVKNEDYFTNNNSPPQFARTLPLVHRSILPTIP